MRTITLKSLIEQIKIEKNLEYSSFTSDDKILKLINKSYRKLYNILVNASESYKYTEADLPVVNFECELPTNFMKLLTVTDPYDSNCSYYSETSVLEHALTQTLPYPHMGTFLLVGNKLKFASRRAPSVLRVRYIPQAEELVEEVFETSTGILGGLTFTSISTGETADEITVAFTAGGTAGSEVVSVVDSSISILIEVGVSTSAQIKTAIENSVDASALVTCSYETSTPENAGLIALTGGVTDGTVSLMANEDDYVVADVCSMLSKRSEEDYKMWQEDAVIAMDFIMKTLIPRNMSGNKKVVDVSGQYFNRPNRVW